MGSYRDVLNAPLAWFSTMPRPTSWGELLISYWQEQIDNIIGTTNGRPRLWLRWGPEVMRWRPAPVGEGDYDFPLCYVAFQNHQPIALPRWVLLERQEPEQFAPGWENHRRQRIEGKIIDVRGPLPKERYTWAYTHSAHEDGCCLKAKNAGNPCWGYYVEPNDEMLNWVREKWKEIVADSDVKPFEDARHFQAPKAQLEARNQIEEAKKAQDELANEIFEDMLTDGDRQLSRSIGEVHAG